MKGVKLIDETFKQLYCCEYEEDSDSFKKAYELCYNYYVYTERFDKSICSHINHKGVAIPTTRDQRQKCNENAKWQWFEVTEEADRFGIEKGTLTLARNKVLRDEQI